MTYKWEVLAKDTWKVIQTETGKTITVGLNALGEHVFSLRHGSAVINYICDHKDEVEAMLEENL
jgi:hypothetical protein